MVDRITRYNRDLSTKQNIWMSSVALPYTRAYTKAFNTYKKVMEDQKDADKEAAEMFVLAASVVTGTVLMATFAKASIRVIAGDAALSFICNNNMERTFNALHAFSNSKAAMFALGAVLDGVKSNAGKEINAAAQRLMRSTPTVMADDPLIMSSYVQQFIIDNAICAQTAGAAIQDDRSLSETERNALLDRLEQAPFCNPPRKKLDEVAFAQKMELSFYMNDILDSDAVVDWPSQNYGSGSGNAGLANAMSSVMNAKRHPITQRPNATDYPRATSPESKWWGTTGYRTIEINSLGSKVRSRVDELHRGVYGMPFYHERGFLDSTPATGPAELKKAETTLDRLARDTRPLRYDDLRV